MKKPVMTVDSEFHLLMPFQYAVLTTPESGMLQRLRCTVVPPRQITGEPLQVCHLAASAGAGNVAPANAQSKASNVIL
jgi:hypothetical protein